MSTRLISVLLVGEALENFLQLAIWTTEAAVANWRSPIAMLAISCRVRSSTSCLASTS